MSELVFSQNFTPKLSTLMKNVSVLTVCKGCASRTG